MELGLRETNEIGDVVSPEGKQTVIASYWSVSSSHIKKSSRDVREWKVTQDLMFCPSAVVVGSFIKTSMTCSHTGGIEGGSGGVIKVGMLEGGLAGGVTEFRQPLQVQSHLEMTGILVQLGHIQRT